MPALGGNGRAPGRAALHGTHGDGGSEGTELARALLMAPHLCFYALTHMPGGLLWDLVCCLRAI